MKILSEGKFRDFEGFIEQGLKPTFLVKLENGVEVKCTDNHKFLTETGWKETKDLTSDDILDGNKFITSEPNGYEIVYDAFNVKETHSFYTNGVTSHNCNMLYIDETAFVERWIQFFSSVFPTLSSGKTTKIIMTSTPNGLNHFYKLCMEGKENGDSIKLLPGKNGYVYIEVKWDRVPGRDFAWMQNQLAGMSFNTEQFDQEFNVAWLGSSGTLISGSSLKAMVMKVPLQESQGLSVYESPIAGKTYVTVVDVSRGKGLDYSAFQIIDVSQMPYNQVCVYKNNLINPTDYSEVIHRVCKSYNDSMILVEVNDIGAQVSDILHQEYEVDTLLFTESAGRSGKRISGGHGVNVDKGIRTTTSVKAIGCSILKMLIEQNQLIIHDYSTIDELSKFSRKGKSYEAESGGHDDLVMPLVLFAWLTTQSFFKDITDINTIMRLREKTDQDMLDDLLPFGFNNHDDEYIQIEPVHRTPSWMEWN